MYFLTTRLLFVQFSYNVNFRAQKNSFENEPSIFKITFILN
ncbi:hypothetical protein X474_18305 [Dethiosulfatarculus sandiegensis]|uniref:Uncharacterized protein n=1 Tax=Dethiosulfatarculus sandiegensis TaxID=1429043 RepID=A0A0D2GCE3_9BACT|nr:hypothetical protein X474_18305 [Dethiosulfatarculus sandiegensis]